MADRLTVHKPERNGVSEGRDRVRLQIQLEGLSKNRRSNYRTWSAICWESVADAFLRALADGETGPVQLAKLVDGAFALVKQN